MYVTHSVRANGDSSDLFLERELLLSVYALPRNTSNAQWFISPSGISA
jgi:hypothetical protein